MNFPAAPARSVDSMIHLQEADDAALDASDRYRTARAYVLILGMLSRHHWVTAKDVQGRLDEAGWRYDVRTVQGLLKSLAEGDADIERDASGKPYRYRLHKDSPNPWIPELSDREALMLLLAVEHLRQLVPGDVLRWLDGRLQEARRRLDPENGASPLRSWPQKVAVVSQLPALLPPAIDSEVFEQVSRALLMDRLLTLDYRNAAGSLMSNKSVMPLALVQQSERLFLVCRFQGYDDLRNLALHRIQGAEATPHSFARPEFSLRQYIRDGGFGFGSGERIELRLLVAPHLAELLAETPLAAGQRIVEAADGRMQVTAEVVRSEQIRWWVRMHGRAVELVAPKDLLSEVDSSKAARTVGK
jgi:predicted DNA-binding transcriptional regulator YafY